MADPQTYLQAAFERAIVQTYGESYRGFDPLLRRSDRADYQANFAMSLAKRLGKKPRDVAAEVQGVLELGDTVRELEIAGPGFVNITLRDEYIARELAGAASGDKLGVSQTPSPETVVVDYSAPNVAKDMHVGHLRPTIIGDALVRVLEAVGHRVIRQNHIGDWGTPFGMLIEQLVDLGLTNADMPIERLNGLYKEARVHFDSDPGFAERARQRVVSLQSGDPDTRALWRRLIAISTRHFSEVYEKLGVTLTPADIAGESSYNDALPDVVRELERRGLAVPSEGAICVFPPGFAGRDGEPLPLILQKKDGGYGYATTDVAALRYRTQTLRASRIVYVIGAPQSQHLAMVFAVGKLAGWLVPPARAEHVAFGSILGSDKKMLKTRSGESPRLIGLLEEAEERARRAVDEKSSDLAPEDKARIAHAVGIGAIKYADLSNDRIKDYVFDWDRMLSFEGNTAPYLMYAHARIRSIFRKGGEQAGGDGGAGSAPRRDVRVSHVNERALALELLHFGSVVTEVASTLEPHRLCTYLYGLATRFTDFYELCPVLKAPTPEERASRLVLCDSTSRTLAAGLALLGIEAPERM